jgi:hypothetical protein
VRRPAPPRACGAFDHERVGDRRWYVPSLLLIPTVSALAYAVLHLTDRPLPQQPEIPPPIPAGGG